MGGYPDFGSGGSPRELAGATLISKMSFSQELRITPRSEAFAPGTFSTRRQTDTKWCFVHVPAS